MKKRKKADFYSLEKSIQNLYHKVDAKSSDSKMTENSVVISIITPSFNQARFIDRTIRSVKNQGQASVEHIIVDGASTDGSIEVISKSQDDLAHFISEKDDGQVDAINKGISLAKGEWIAFQNSDDIYLPGSFEAFLKAIEENPDADIIAGDQLSIDANDKIIDIWLGTGASFRAQIYFAQTFHNQSCIIRRRVFEKYGLFDASYRFSFDREFFTRILKNKLNTVHIPKFLGGFRYHEDTKTSNLADVNLMESQKVTEKYGIFPFTIIPRKIRGLPFVVHKAFIHIVRGEFWYLFRNVM